VKPPATFSNTKPLVNPEITTMTMQSREPVLVKFGALDGYMANGSGTTGTYWASQSEVVMEQGWKQLCGDVR